MTTQHRAFHITTTAGAQGDALMAQLATQTQAVDPSRALVFGIELFPHVYDPDAFRAWLAYLHDPILGTAVQYDRDQRRSGGTRVSASPVNVAQAVGGQGGPVQVTPASPVSTGSAPLPLPAWALRIAQVIDTLPPDVQVREAQHCVESVMKALLALNVSPQAIGPLRLVYERKLGWFRRGDENNYYRGVWRGYIEDRTQARRYEEVAPGHEGEWRQEAARLSLAHVGRVRPGDARGYPPRDVVFGFWKDYNKDDVGCRIRDGVAVTMPRGCRAPTGECHTLWIEGDAQIAGGRMYAPSALPREIRAEASFSMSRGLGTVDPRGYIPHLAIVGPGPGWNQGVLVGYEEPRPYLHFYVPPKFYWDIFFAPQPEFAGLNFVDWLAARSPEENIRQMRRDNTTRLNVIAQRFGLSTVGELIGKANATIISDVRREEEERQAYEGIGSAAVQGVARALGPVAGVVTGAGQALYAVFKGLTAQANEDGGGRRWIDVYGHLTPAFTAFAINEKREGFEETVAYRVGMPPTAPVAPTQIAMPVGQMATLVLAVLPGLGGAAPGSADALATMGAQLAVTGPEVPPPPAATGMGTGTKVALTVGVGAAIAGTVWALRRR